MAKLTELEIKNLKPKDRLYKVSDGNGLWLEVTPAGGKHWRFRYRFQDKEQMMALGSYPSVKLAQARIARADARELLDSGKHPTREKKAQKIRQTAISENTFEAIARKWLDLKEDGLNAKYHKQCLARLEQHVFPSIGALPVTEITIPDVVNVVEAISKRGTVETAKRMKQLIGQVFRYAARRGMCIHNPAADLRDILPSKQEKHHACIHPSELPALLEKIHEQKDNALGKYALLLMLLTFVRTNELIAAKWDEIDWQREEWHIPKERMKMRRPHLVPLARQTLAILKELKTITGDTPYLFYSAASKSKHISNGTILMALRRMGYQNEMTGHGFRSLASTILNEKGYAPDVIERQLAHEDEDKIRSAYNRAEYLLDRKKMMAEYAEYLDMAKNVHQKNVVHIGDKNHGQTAKN